MSKFKVGDVVVAIEDFKSVIFDGSLLTQGKEYTVLSVTTFYTRVVTDRGTVDGFSERVFELVQDDELPPAPESVLYVTDRSGPHRQLSVVIDGGLIDMYASDGRDNGKSVVLGPDEALQLCHDLRRMAMSIKRKEKHND